MSAPSLVKPKEGNVRRLYQSMFTSGGQDGKEVENGAANPVDQISDQKVDSSLGFVNAADGAFTSLEPDKTATQQSSESNSEKWQRIASRSVKRECWNRLAFYGIGLVNLPEDIISLWDRIEREKQIQITEESRLLYFKAFARAALGTSMLHFKDCESLIKKLGLSAHLTRMDMDTMMNSKLEETGSLQSSPENNEFFDFEHFASLVCDLLVMRAKLEEAAAANRGWNDKFPVDPDCRPKQAWDIFIMLLLLYCSFAVPFAVAFDDVKGLLTSDRSDLLIDIILLIDIVLSFITAYDSEGILVRNFRKIARTYVKGWFIPDFVGSFPFDQVIAEYLRHAGQPLSTNTIQTLRLLRMLKLIRALKFLSRMGRLRRHDGLEAYYNLISLVTTLFMLVFAAHLLGCVFTMIISDPTANWLYQYRPALMHADASTRYTAALYWAIITISTMGYGDIVPSNHIERIYVIFVSMFGAVLFSYCLGTISSLIAQVTVVDDRFLVKGQALIEYVRFRDLSVTLKRRIKTFYLLCWQSSPIPYQEREIFDELDEPLRLQLMREIGAKKVHELPILQGFDDECIGYIALRLKRTVFFEGDVVYHRGERARDMYFIITGNVSLHYDDNVGVKPVVNGAAQDENASSDWTLGDGDTFGELALFPGFVGVKRVDTAVALSMLTAYTLSVDELPGLEQLHPRFVRKLKELCELQSVEWKLNHQGSEEPVAVSADALRPCKLKTRINQIKSDLIRQRELQVLKPAAGDTENQILKAYRPQDNLMQADDKVPVQWHSLSCVLSEKGEVLVIEHDFMGLTNANPSSLGYLIPGRSTFHVLDEKETFRYGGSSRKELFGCSLLLFPQRERQDARGQDTALEGGSSPDSCRTIGRQILLFTWSHEEFDTLCDGFKDWLSSGLEENICSDEDRDSDKGPEAVSKAANVSESFASPIMTPTTIEQGKKDPDPYLEVSKQICASQPEKVIVPQELDAIQADLHELKLEVARLNASLNKLISVIEVKQSTVDQNSARTRPDELQERLLSVSEDLLNCMASGVWKGMSDTENKDDKMSRNALRERNPEAWPTSVVPGVQAFSTLDDRPPSDPPDQTRSLNTTQAANMGTHIEGLRMLQDAINSVNNSGKGGHQVENSGVPRQNDLRNEHRRSFLPPLSDDDNSSDLVSMPHRIAAGPQRDRESLPPDLREVGPIGAGRGRTPPSPASGPHQSPGPLDGITAQRTSAESAPQGSMPFVNRRPGIQFSQRHNTSQSTPESMRVSVAGQFSYTLQADAEDEPGASLLRLR